MKARFVALTASAGIALFGLSIPVHAAGPTVVTPGYQATVFADGFPGRAVFGLGFDPTSPTDFYVASGATVFKFGSAGGSASSATALNIDGDWVPNHGLWGLTFDKQGNLFVMSTGHVIEVDKSTGHAIRTVAVFGTGLGLATDPLSGDIFASGLGGVYRISNADSDSPSVTLYSPSPEGENTGPDGITFAADGTIYAAEDNVVYKITGTNAGAEHPASPYALVDTADGLAAGADPANPSKNVVFVNANSNGTITRLDPPSTSSSPPTPWTIATWQDARGDFAILGPDGCLYATETNVVVQVCAQAPTSITYTGATSGDYADPATLSAVLTNTKTNAVVSGQTLSFKLGDQSCSGTTDADGSAACTITPDAAAGIQSLEVDFAGNDSLLASQSTGSFAVGLEESALSYTGDSGNIGAGSSAHLSASLSEPGGGPIAGRIIVFQLGTQSCNASTDGSGAAACNVVLSQDPGIKTITATFTSDGYYSGVSATASADLLDATSLTYNGATSQDFDDLATLSGTLTDTTANTAVAAGTVSFSVAGQTCSAQTDSSGKASCNVMLVALPGATTVAASYSGSTIYAAASTSMPFTVNTEETTITITGPTTPVAVGSSVSLSAVLREDGTTPIAGRAATLGLGSQSCATVTTASGTASCSVVAATPLGPQALTATFAGDAYYRAARATGSAIVYGYVVGGGAFVIGEGSLTNPVTFWSAQWWQENILGETPPAAAFKGFAGAPALPACGVSWSAGSGTSTPPPSAVPAYMAVIVASSETRSGSTITGNTVKIVVVRTDPGYDPNAGHAGTGTIVGTPLCG